MDPEGSRVIELRFFGGLTHEEIAEIEDISVSSVRRRWRVAKLWLYRELAGDSTTPGDS
jgi:DNA-directed RNA polymerase specialized sigma24 family protein